MKKGRISSKSEIIFAVRHLNFRYQRDLEALQNLLAHDYGTTSGLGDLHDDSLTTTSDDSETDHDETDHQSLDGACSKKRKKRKKSKNNKRHRTSRFSPAPKYGSYPNTPMSNTEACHVSSSEKPSIENEENKLN